MNRGRSGVLVLLTAACFVVGARDLFAQGAAGDSVEVVLGQRYEAGGVRSFFWGDHYREAWTTPLKLPILDLTSYAGGLVPVRTAGGSQTASLVLAAPDGRTFQFRLIDKDPTRGLPEAAREEPIVEFLQDQVSSLHPLAVMVVHVLEEAVGVLHPEPEPFVMPDDSGLGAFDEAFAGRAGVLVPRLDEEEGARFEGFSELITTEALIDRLGSSDETVDAEALLRARLVDLVVGDWNRHPGQWIWGRADVDQPWTPIALDRDHAFSRRDGLVPTAAQYLVRGFVGFGPDYPSIYDLHHEAREVDRRLLATVERDRWISVTSDVAGRLTDDVIAEAVAGLPAALVRLDGATLSAALRARRDHLAEASTEFYRLVNEVLEVSLGSGHDELVIYGRPDGRLAVTAQSGQRSVFERVVDPSDTEEIRIYAGDGDDLIRVSSDPGFVRTDAAGRRLTIQPEIRVIGGAGDDVVRHESGTIRVRFYDAEGVNQFQGAAPDRRIETRPYAASGVPSDERGLERPVHWGRWLVPDATLDFSSDFGLFLGVGATGYRYGFRQDPYGRRVRLVGGMSTEGKIHIEYEADFRGRSSAKHLTLQAYASELDVVNFFGFGNDTRRFATSDSADARRRELALRPRFGNQIGRNLDIGIGLTLELSQTLAPRNPFLNEVTIDDEGDFETVPGADGFVQAGMFADVRYDSRDDGDRPTRGLFFEGRAALYPGVLDVGEEYGSIELAARTYLSAPTMLFEPTVAVRAGARRLLGEFPFFDAAIVGGSRTLRGFDSDRFAGDSAIWGGVDLRLKLAEPRILFLGTLGAIGFVDVGRVFYEGESPGGWHTGYGGGLWLTPLGVDTTISALMARGQEATRFYIYVGMPF